MSSVRGWRFLLLALAFVVAGSPTPSTFTNDNDGDGIDDALEAQLAAQFLPEMRYHSEESCDGPDSRPVLFRLRHPSIDGVVDTNYIAINYVRLYAWDCGPGDHLGDNEPFLVFLKLQNGTWQFSSLAAVCHKDTTCEVRSADLNPILWIGRNKHGGFADLSKCVDGTVCDNHCQWDGPSHFSHTLYNVGEPNAHLVNSLWDVHWPWGGEYVWNDPQFLDAGNIESGLYTNGGFIQMTAPPALHACLVSCQEQFRQCRRDGNGFEQCLNEQTLCENICYYENRSWDP